MGYPTRTSSVRVCHFATSAGRPRISLEPDLSLKFSAKKWKLREIASEDDVWFRLASFMSPAIVAIIE
jgi:hypothetical protein